MKQTRDWENQYITQKNRYPMHTPYGAYETVEQALAGNRSASRFVMDLNGDWKFKIYPSPEAVEAFYEENFDHAAWDTIPVPSNWELQDMESRFTPICCIRSNGRQTAKHLRSRLPKAPTS